MASFESLPADQRAVLQMVLQRGRSYDEIAALLAIDRSAVRQRALDALDALGPDTAVPRLQRGLITDYLLGQLPDGLADDVRGQIAASPADRAWARVLAAELGPLSAAPLPEIPSAPDSAAAQDRPQEHDRAGWEHPDDTARSDSPARRPASGAPRSSRRGGAILLTALALLVVAAIAVIIITSLSSGSSSSGAAHRTTTDARGTTTTSRVKPTPIFESTLSAPSGAKSPTGGLVVFRYVKTIGMLIGAKGLAANTTNPPTAYAVWLTNTQTGKEERVGFYDKQVTSDGKLSAVQEVPADASLYNTLLITLEDSTHPDQPGKIVLSGRFQTTPSSSAS